MLQKDFKHIGHHSESYQLSVVIMADSFFYSIFDDQNSLITHHSYKNIHFSDESVQVILEDQALNHQYNQINVVSLGGNAHQLALPDDDFIHSLPTMAWKELYKEQLPGQYIYNYFGITPSQLDLLNQLFKNYNYPIHDFSFLLTAYYIGIDSPCVHVHFEDHLITIFIQHEGKVQFYNTFTFTTEKDVLYFVLAALNYAHLDPKSNSVQVTGWIDPKSTIFTLLKSYISQLTMLEDADFLINTKENYQAANYFIHFINRLCAL